MADRDSRLDMAKGVAMLCVALSHSAGLPRQIFAPCMAFDVALFYIVSGYLMTPARTGSPCFVRKQIRSVAVPFVLTVLAIGLVAPVVTAVESADLSTLPGLIAKWIASALYGAAGIEDLAGAHPDLWPLGALWFLPALAEGKIMLAAIGALPERARPLTAAAIAFAGAMTARIVWLPLSLQAGMEAVLFLYAGQLVRERGWLEAVCDPIGAWGRHGRTHGAAATAVCVAGFAYLAFCSATGTAPLLSVCQHPNGFALDAPLSMAAAFAVLALCSACLRAFPDAVGGLVAFGRGTLVFLCCHSFWLKCLPYTVAGSAAIASASSATGIPAWAVEFAAGMVFSLAAQALVSAASTRLRQLRKPTK